MAYYSQQGFYIYFIRYFKRSPCKHVLPVPYHFKRNVDKGVDVIHAAQ